jgi:hypothetical protein
MCEVMAIVVGHVACWAVMRRLCISFLALEMMHERGHESMREGRRVGASKSLGQFMERCKSGVSSLKTVEGGISLCVHGCNRNLSCS